MICIWSSWCQYPIICCFIKIQNGLPFWCRLIQVIRGKRPLNGCSSSSSRHRRNRRRHIEARDCIAFVLQLSWWVVSWNMYICTIHRHLIDVPFPCPPPTHIISSSTMSHVGTPQLPFSRPQNSAARRPKMSIRRWKTSIAVRSEVGLRIGVLSIQKGCSPVHRWQCPWDGHRQMSCRTL